MTRKYLAFDLEIAAIIPDGETDWKRHRPLGITCAATFRSDEPAPLIWHGMGNDPEDYQPRMSKNEVGFLVDYLACQGVAGYTILTWNGLSFDFNVLAEESGMHDECVELALNHVDMMFHIFCLRGHYLGLDKAAKGLGLPGKTEGMNGALAPQLWSDGNYQQVLDYVAQDAHTTLDVAQAAEVLGGVPWTSQKGKQNLVGIERWLPVREAMGFSLPDTSWMTNPPTRESFTKWMVRS